MKTNLVELVLQVVTLDKAAALLCEFDEGEFHDLLQEVAVVLNLLQTPTRRILGEAVRPNPAQVTADPGRYKLQHTLGEAVALSLLTRSGWRVENSPLHQLEVAVQPSVGVEINTVSLTQPSHVNTRPELASLVQVDLVAESEVLGVAAVLVSWWRTLII